MKKNKKQKNTGSLSKFLFLLCLIGIIASIGSLIKIGMGYLKGRNEYARLLKTVTNSSGDEKNRDSSDQEEHESSALQSEENPDDIYFQDQFSVNFDELLEMNDDTIGWIRFHPEPEQISYPIVQGEDNSYYLKHTFNKESNAAGTIFMDCENAADFSDKNTILYGHRMRDRSMFRDLENYRDKEFWQANPYFYIYTVDGREIAYQIYSVGVAPSLSASYTIGMTTEEEFQTFIDGTKKIADYDTGVEVTTEDLIVTLSTCTAASDNNRVIVHGVKKAERQMQK